MSAVSFELCYDKPRNSTVSSLTTLGRRESVKKEKRQRIIAAARRVFTAVGFERATTQEIAKQAGVATGTLFLYARDKRELLLMVFNDQLESVTDASIAAGDEVTPLVEDLLAFYRRRLTFWGSDVPLARVATGEVYASRAPDDIGAELARANVRQERLLTALTKKVAAYARTHGVQLRDEPATIANAIHYLYIGELRIWLSQPEPNVEDALGNLQRLFTLLVHGMVATANGAHPAHAGAKIRE